ncbi:uncharacterized protein LY79DRAFT_205028 [Colletotrichum navitas]|uniref:Uncharacterized protein n=1 Tax=Colletotrichum navitas TaxID=681940 RepID=A0AAD8VBH8_9PEZI|nr:uncharacterized protein LY79DRAFT_205028 [Colletotrichum navitas]KAK1599001.1 hypothetical protein LY79DRAFT_205028 [Colletotrichum navitas]
MHMALTPGLDLDLDLDLDLAAWTSGLFATCTGNCKAPASLPSYIHAVHQPLVFTFASTYFGSLTFPPAYLVRVHIPRFHPFCLASPRTLSLYLSLSLPGETTSFFFVLLVRRHSTTRYNLCRRRVRCSETSLAFIIVCRSNPTNAQLVSHRLPPHPLPALHHRRLPLAVFG